MGLPLVVAVVGPTATGKSDLGIALAQALDGEVVNADAMQLYRGMDVGTAKLTPAEQQGVPHHLLDVLDVVDEASVAAYQRAADSVVDDLLARGRTPVLVGGSGLYVRAALDELTIPPTEPAVRARLEAEAADLGASALHERLQAVDPVAASQILPTNTRRVVRALEVVELTGAPFVASLPDPVHRRPTVQVGLRAALPVLDARIERRVVGMWAGGLLDEVRRLDRLGLRTGLTASRAVGYAQALAELDGTSTTTEAQDDTARATRRLARRQRSWFGRDRRTTWLDVDDAAPAGLLDAALDVVRTAAAGAR
ncbi:tRNA (adenosine(37)-N6)-dimethylallyltransferase MiaA [Angustibacter aerolatus]